MKSNFLNFIVTGKYQKLFEDDGVTLEELADDEYKTNDNDTETQDNGDENVDEPDIDYEDKSILDEPTDSNGENHTPNDGGANIGGGILPICQTTGKILLAQRSDRVKEPGKWSIWGGRLDISTKAEANEKYIENKTLEIFEELTKYNKFNELKPSYVYKTEENKFEWYNFLGLVDEEFEPITDWRVMNYKWMTKEEVKELGRDNIHYGLQLLFDNDSASIRPLLIPKSPQHKDENELVQEQPQQTQEQPKEPQEPQETIEEPQETIEEPQQPEIGEDAGEGIDFD